MKIFENKYVQTAIIITVVIVILWLACLLIDKLGGHLNGGFGVGSFDTNFKIGTTK
jgi:hypothetical protein